MTINDQLLNKEISHAIDVLGYSNAVTKKIINILNKTDVDLFNKLTLELNKVIPSPEKISRIKALLKSVNEINSSAYAKVSDQLKLDLKQFSQEEVNYQQKLIGSVQPVKVLPISPEAAYASAIATPFQGKFLGEFLSGMETQKANLIRDAVRIGFIESQTTGEIVNKIRGTKALNYTDGIMNITKANAESVVLTAIAHTANVAQQALYDANEDIIKGYRYTATLDTRTTELCASRDGKFYKLGEPKPAIPAHFRCRSRYVAVIKSFKELGLDVDLPESTRASMDGQVPSKTTYQEWLKKQSVERQNEVLGVTKAKLFREGNLPIDKFVSPAGHVYTLDELKIRNAKQYYLGESIVSADLSKLTLENQNILKDMYDKAAQNKNGFDQVNQSIANAVDGTRKIAKLKGSTRTVEKILADYDGDPTQVKDLLRTTIEVKSLKDVDAVIDNIRAKYGDPVKLRNSLRIDSPSLDGYRDVNMVIKYNGSLAEVQINIGDMLEAKKIYHKEYEVVRTLRGIVETEKRALTIAEQEKLNTALEKMERGYNYAWEKALKDKGR